MFKITIPIQKAKKGAAGILIVEGVASDDTIDKDEERFDRSALAQMEQSVSEGNIPIRVEHDNRFYTEVGKWTEATLTKDNKLQVKGEIDTNLSLGKDIEIFLSKGKEMALSVGGRVADAIYEYSKELGKNIRTYKDVLLEEISVVGNPANYNASLSLGKSVDWQNLSKSADKKIKYTTQAQKLMTIYKNMQPISTDQFMELSNETTEAKKSLSFEEILQGAVEVVQKSFTQDELAKDYEVACDEFDSCGSISLSPQDMQTIIEVSKFLDQVDIPEDMSIPAGLDDWNFVEKLPEESFIILSDRSKVMPHHNGDFTLNQEFVAYALKSLFGGRGYFKPKDYSIAINHLYYHLKELSMLKTPEKSATKKSDNKNQVDFSTEQIAIMEKCYNYLQKAEGDVPSVDKEALSYGKVLKLSKGYEYLLNNNLIKEIMPNNVKKHEEEETLKEEELVEEVKVEETPAEEPKADETQPEEKKDEEKVEEEAPAEEAIEKEETDEEVVEEDKDDEEVVEDAVEESEEEASDESTEEIADEEVPVDGDKESDEAEAPAEDADDSTEEAPATEEVVEEAPEEEAPADDNIVEEEVSKKFDKSFDTLQKSFVTLEAKFEKMAIVEKKVNDLSTIIEGVSKSLEQIGEYVTTRKSVKAYQVLEKTFSSSEVNKESDLESVVNKYQDDGLSFTDAYAKAKKEQA